VFYRYFLGLAGLGDQGPLCVKDFDFQGATAIQAVSGAAHSRVVGPDGQIRRGLNAGNAAAYYHDRPDNFIGHLFLPCCRWMFSGYDRGIGFLPAQLSAP